MNYMLLQQTIDHIELDLSLTNDYHVRLKPLLADASGIISQTSYTAVYDNTQHLALAQRPNKPAAESQTQDEDMTRKPESRDRTPRRSDYRLRIGPEMALPAQNGHATKSLSAQHGQPKVGRFMVVYQQPLSEQSKPIEHQDIPVLVGLPEDEEPVEGVLYGVDVLRDLVDSAVYQDGSSLVWLSSWPTVEDAVRYTASIDRMEGDDVHLIEVVRDHGTHDERQPS